MKDALLTSQDREEALSLVYTRAVAAGAGYVTSDCEFDRDGVDLRIHTVHIPKANVFHIESLRALMDQSREGRIA